MRSGYSPLDQALLVAAGALTEPALRALDAIHVAAAIDLAPVDAFVTYDERQAAAARLAGLRRCHPALDAGDSRRERPAGLAARAASSLEDGMGEWLPVDPGEQVGDRHVGHLRPSDPRGRSDMGHDQAIVEAHSGSSAAIGSGSVTSSAAAQIVPPREGHRPAPDDRRSGPEPC